MTLQPIPCVIIDDEPLACQLLASYAERTPTLALQGSYTSANEAFARIAQGDIRLVFLDIQMPQLSGMELARLLPPQTLVVFVTAYERYAVEGFKVNAVDYLLKPVSYAEFVGAVGRAQARLQPSPSMDGEIPAPSIPSATSVDTSSEYIIVKSEYRLRQIAKSQIEYIEGLKDYVKIYVQGESKSVMTLLSMRAIESVLPTDRFLRVHRSYIVNLQRLRLIERNHILMECGREIPVGDSYREAVNAYVASRTIG